MSFTLRSCKHCGVTGDIGPERVCTSCISKPARTQEELREFAQRLSTAFAAKSEVKPAVANKPSISLIPREAIFEMAKAFDYGTGKHGRYAFRDGVEYTKLIDAALRHLLAITDGEDVDADSQCLHAANAMSNLAMLIYCMKSHPEKDDRWKK